MFDFLQIVGYNISTKRRRMVMKNLKNYLQMIIAGAITLVGVGLFIGGIKTRTKALLVIGLIVIAAGLVYYYLMKDRARRTCPHCGANLNGAEYSYQLKSAEEIEYKDGQNGYKTKEKYAFGVRVICPVCGEEKEFDYKYTAFHGENPDFYVEKYLKNLYRRKIREKKK